MLVSQGHLTIQQNCSKDGLYKGLLRLAPFVPQYPNEHCYVMAPVLLHLSYRLPLFGTNYASRFDVPVYSTFKENFATVPTCNFDPFNP